MKKVFLMLLVLSPLWAAAATALSGGLTLNALRHVPYPAEPGRHVELWMDVYASETQRDVTCRLDPSSPFSLEPGQSAERSLPLLTGRQSWVNKYTLRVASDAVLGNNTITFGCQTATSTFIASNFSIYVQPQSGNLAIDRVKTNPEKVEPGQRVDVELVLKNLGGTDFKNVRVALNVSDKLVPVQSSSEKIVGLVVGQSEETVSFGLVVSPDAESKPLRVPVTLTFEDTGGTKYTQKGEIGIQVGASPKLDVELSESTIRRPGTLGSVTLRIVNRGLEDVQFLNLELAESDGFETTTQKSQYIGSIASDDYETAEYALYVREASPTLDLTLTYRDANNHAYTEKIQVTVPTYTDEQIQRFKLEPQGGVDWLTGLVALVVLFFVGRWGYRKWVKKK
ncbi:hypothetical protein HY572_00545 [Candidatus Micrarchaeota archaeon]|nr:hypothetical protein [Candidatus Micrarchaeota archaeon]